MDIQDKTIAVIGLGYVGLPLAVEFGKQRRVIGFDIKPERIADLRAGQDKVFISTLEFRSALYSARLSRGRLSGPAAV